MLKYQRFSADLFMLILRPNVPRSRLKEHPHVIEVARAVSGLRVDGAPRHPDPTKPRHYSGWFQWEGERFKVASVYAFRGFFALTCKPLDGAHSTEDMQKLVDAINTGIVPE